MIFRVVRLQFEGVAGFRFGLFVASHPLKGCTEVIVIFRVVRRQIDGSAGFRFGLSTALHCIEGRAEAVVIRGVVRLQFEGAAVFRFGLFVASHPIKGCAEIDVIHSVVRLLCCQLTQESFRLGVVALVEGCDSLAEAGAGAFGVAGDAVDGFIQTIRLRSACRVCGCRVGLFGAGRFARRPCGLCQSLLCQHLVDFPDNRRVFPSGLLGSLVRGLHFEIQGVTQEDHQLVKINAIDDIAARRLHEGLCHSINGLASIDGPIRQLPVAALEFFQIFEQELH